MNKYFQTIKDSFEIILITSKGKHNLIESDRGRQLYNITFQKILHNNIIKHYSRDTYLGAVFAKHFNRTARDLLENPFLRKEKAIGLIYYLQ